MMHANTIEELEGPLNSVEKKSSHKGAFENGQIISVFGTFQKIFHNGPQLISTDEQTYHFC